MGGLLQRHQRKMGLTRVTPSNLYSRGMFSYDFAYRNATEDGTVAYIGFAYERLQHTADHWADRSSNY